MGGYDIIMKHFSIIIIIQIQMHKYEKIKKIGRGTYGDVLLVKRKSDGKLLALKKVAIENLIQSSSSSGRDSTTTKPTVPIAIPTTIPHSQAPNSKIAEKQPQQLQKPVKEKNNPSMLSSKMQPQNLKHVAPSQSSLLDCPSTPPDPHQQQQQQQQQRSTSDHAMHIKVHEVLKESMQGKGSRRFVFDEGGAAAAGAAGTGPGAGGQQAAAGGQVNGAGPESTLQSQSACSVEEGTKNSSEETQKALNNEIQILRTLSHKNIIKYYESFSYKKHLCIVTEYAQNGDLQKKIKEAKNSGKKISQQQIMDWFCQLALALGHIHSKNILHRDLKPKNILLTKNNVIKIGDFGISKMLENTFDMAKTATGTPYYLSPEVCLGQRYDNKSDMWMLGCILYEMCALRRPFEGESLNQVLNRILKEDPKKLSDQFDPIFHRLIDLLLQKSASLRASIQEILELPEIRENIDKLTNKQRAPQKCNDDSFRIQYIQPISQKKHAQIKDQKGISINNFMLETVSQDDPSRSSQSQLAHDTQKNVYSDFKNNQKKQQANFNGELTFGGDSHSKNTTYGTTKYGKTSQDIYQVERGVKQAGSSDIYKQSQKQSQGGSSLPYAPSKRMNKVNSQLECNNGGNGGPNGHKMSQGVKTNSSKSVTRQQNDGNLSGHLEASGDSLVLPAHSTSMAEYQGYHQSHQAVRPLSQLLLQHPKQVNILKGSCSSSQHGYGGTGYSRQQISKGMLGQVSQQQHNASMCEQTQRHDDSMASLGPVNCRNQKIKVMNFWPGRPNNNQPTNIQSHSPEPLLFNSSHNIIYQGERLSPMAQSTSQNSNKPYHSQNRSVISQSSNEKDLNRKQKIQDLLQKAKNLTSPNQQQLAFDQKSRDFAKSRDREGPDDEVDSGTVLQKIETSQKNEHDEIEHDEEDTSIFGGISQPFRVNSPEKMNAHRDYENDDHGELYVKKGASNKTWLSAERSGGSLNQRDTMGTQNNDNGYRSIFFQNDKMSQNKHSPSVEKEKQNQQSYPQILGQQQQKLAKNESRRIHMRQNDMVKLIRCSEFTNSQAGMEYNLDISAISNKPFRPSSQLSDDNQNIDERDSEQIGKRTTIHSMLSVLSLFSGQVPGQQQPHNCKQSKPINVISDIKVSNGQIFEESYEYPEKNGSEPKITKVKSYPPKQIIINDGYNKSQNQQILREMKAQVSNIKPSDAPVELNAPAIATPAVSRIKPVVTQLALKRQQKSSQDHLKLEKKTSLLKPIPQNLNSSTSKDFPASSSSAIDHQSFDCHTQTSDPTKQPCYKIKTSQISRCIPKKIEGSQQQVAVNGRNSACSGEATRHKDEAARHKDGGGRDGAVKVESGAQQRKKSLVKILKVAGQACQKQGLLAAQGHKQNDADMNLTKNRSMLSYIKKSAEQSLNQNKMDRNNQEGYKTMTASQNSLPSAQTGFNFHQTLNKKAIQINTNLEPGQSKKQYEKALAQAKKCIKQQIVEQHTSQTELKIDVSTTNDQEQNQTGYSQQNKQQKDKKQNQASISCGNITLLNIKNTHGKAHIKEKQAETTKAQMSVVGTVQQSRDWRQATQSQLLKTPENDNRGAGTQQCQDANGLLGAVNLQAKKSISGATGNVGQFSPGSIYIPNSFHHKGVAQGFKTQQHRQTSLNEAERQQQQQSLIAQNTIQIQKQVHKKRNFISIYNERNGSSQKQRSIENRNNSAKSSETSSDTQINIVGHDKDANGDTLQDTQGKNQISMSNMPKSSQQVFNSRIGRPASQMHPQTISNMSLKAKFGIDSLQGDSDAFVDPNQQNSIENNTSNLNHHHRANVSAQKSNSTIFDNGRSQKQTANQFVISNSHSPFSNLKKHQAKTPQDNAIKGKNHLLNTNLSDSCENQPDHDEDHIYQGLLKPDPAPNPQSKQTTSVFNKNSQQTGKDTQHIPILSQMKRKQIYTTTNQQQKQGQIGQYILGQKKEVITSKSGVVQHQMLQGHDQYANQPQSAVQQSKQQTKYFTFEQNGIFNPKNPVSPARGHLATEFVKQRIGKQKYDQIIKILNESENPVLLLNKNASQQGDVSPAILEQQNQILALINNDRNFLSILQYIINCSMYFRSATNEQQSMKDSSQNQSYVGSKEEVRSTSYVSMAHTPNSGFTLNSNYCINDADRNNKLNVGGGVSSSFTKKMSYDSTGVDEDLSSKHRINIDKQNSIGQYSSDVSNLGLVGLGSAKSGPDAQKMQFHHRPQDSINSIGKGKKTDLQQKLFTPSTQYTNNLVGKQSEENPQRSMKQRRQTFQISEQQSSTSDHNHQNLPSHHYLQPPSTTSAEGLTTFGMSSHHNQQTLSKFGTSNLQLNGGAGNSSSGGHPHTSNDHLDKSISSTLKNHHVGVGPNHTKGNLGGSTGVFQGSDDNSIFSRGISGTSVKQLQSQQSRTPGQQQAPSLRQLFKQRDISIEKYKIQLPGNSSSSKDQPNQVGQTTGTLQDFRVKSSKSGQSFTPFQ